jgi:hypothetical protein
MGNKTLVIFLVIILVVLIGVAVYFYLGTNKCKTMATDLGAKLQECSTGAEQLKTNLDKCLAGEKEITSVRLEKFPAGTEIKTGVQGTITTKFKKGDLMGISGEATITGGTGKAVLTFQILDQNGVIVQSGGQGMELKGSGGFGMCCITFPETAGEYTLKLFLDGKEAKTTFFEVVP